MEVKYGGAWEWFLCCVAMFNLFEFSDLEHLSRFCAIPAFGWPLAAVAAAGCIVFVRFYIPPPGYAPAAMAVVAGIIALRPKMRGPEKSVWFLILLGFMVVEIRAIRKDRHEQNEKFEKAIAELG